MRKALILTTVLVGIGGLVAAAQASQDRAPEKDGAQVTSQTESPGKDDAEDIGAPRGERTPEAHKRHREEHREAHEEEDDDRD